MNIYLQGENDFEHNGLGFLTDILSAKVEDNLNGDYSLLFEYKIGGNLSEYLQNENIVRCKVSDGTKQLFIIKNVVKTFDSIQVIAKHIFYDLIDNFVEDVYPKNLAPQPFLQWILDKTNYTHRFKAFSDISTPKSARYVRKNPVDCILGDTDNSMVNLFNGELKRDNFNIHFNKKIGNDNGVKLIAGKNITGINITLDTNSVHTRIMPQGFDGLLLPEKYINSPLINNYTNPKIYRVEFGDIKYDPKDEEAFHDIEEAYAALRNATNELFEAGIDKPTINVKIDWIELSKTNEYKNYSNLERVDLGDIITIDLLGVIYKSEIIKTIYNPLTDRIDKFEIGTPKATISSSTNQILRKIAKINPTSILEQAKKNATEQLTKAMGGFVYKTENELFIMDTNDVTTAKKVWRWNLNGLGYSKNGINGPYETAITQDGQIVANFITTGKLNTSVIEGYDSLTTTVKDAKDMVEGQNQKISQINQTVDEINSKLSNIADVTISGESTFANLTLEHINQSEPITIKIHPIGEDIAYLGFSDEMLWNDNLFWKNRVLRITNIKTGWVYDYEIPRDLLYYDENNYDELVISYNSQTCYINKKVKHTVVNGVNELMEETQIIECDYPKIELEDGDYKFELLGYKNGYIYAQLMASNIYTTQFTTKVEMNSAIKQTTENIGLSVDEKLSNYSTTNEMNSAIQLSAKSIINTVSETYATQTELNNTSRTLITKIEQTSTSILNTVSGTYTTQDETKNINAKLELKLNTNDLVSELNASADIINLKSNRLIINSTNFSLSKDGTVKAINVDITGKITATSGTFSGTVYASAGEFTGKVTATSGSFTGSINSNSGNIAGWEITSHRLFKQGSNYRLYIEDGDGDSKGDFLTVTNASGGDISVRIKANGYAQFTNADITGKITATSGSFSGSIYASGGTIGGWNIRSGNFYGTSGSYNITMNAEGLWGEKNGIASFGGQWDRICNGTAVSDKRLKKNISNIDEKYHDFFMKLKPVEFNYNEKSGLEENQKHLGFIAQDVLKNEEENNLKHLSIVSYNLNRYELDKRELIALNTYEIQRIYKIIEEMKEGK